MKLRNRKFELDRLNRSYNQVSASGKLFSGFYVIIQPYSMVERCLQDHVQSQAVRHEPNITNLVKRFNSLCDELTELVRKRHAPHHAVAPKKLDRSTIFSLDVDDPIWNDRGLVGEDVESPAWLADEDVQGDIAALLTYERCKEEECYLVREACFLEAWFKTEWATLAKCIELCGKLTSS